MQDTQLGLQLLGKYGLAPSGWVLAPRAAALTIGTAALLEDHHIAAASYILFHMRRHVITTGGLYFRLPLRYPS